MSYGNYWVGQGPEQNGNTAALEKKVDELSRQSKAFDSAVYYGLIVGLGYFGVSTLINKRPQPDRAILSVLYGASTTLGLGIAKSWLS